MPTKVCFILLGFSYKFTQGKIKGILHTVRIIQTHDTILHFDDRPFTHNHNELLALSYSLSVNSKIVVIPSLKTMNNPSMMRNAKDKRLMEKQILRATSPSLSKLATTPVWEVTD